MASYDLIPRMIPYMDRHLVFPLLEFLSLNKIYPNHDLLKAKYELLAKTNMVDFISELYKQIHDTDEVPSEFASKRQEVLQTLENLQTEAQKVLDIIENPEVIAALRQDKLQNLHFLKEKYGLTDEMVNTLYQFGQFQYNCGNYGGASDMLYHFRVLSTDHELNLSALWGKLASDILDLNWDAALEEVQKLRETIDSKSFASPLHQLQQRTWFIHWSIFVFFNHPKGRDSIIDVFFNPSYINTIQTSCPWILRYLTTAVVTNKRRKNILKDLIKIIQQESYEYRDPITEFIESLYVKFDFEGAQHKLKECEEVLSNDFFLVATKMEFIENARYLISETYCRIHLKIDIGGLSQTLNLGQEEGEKWIVNLIRDTRVDAKIDFKENTVIMNQNHTSIYQQVIERTKGLSFRSQVLSSAIEKCEALQSSNAIDSIVE
ncbi:eIF3 subunit 6 N terminal domain-containing protein [Gigaspora rosea]|uniref:Eukaryotic translation initiation factor 3 subunit E n=1 Tax=Gigaspora rosea TaxID=44941 RepID=A0A397URC5_9GLOM|nr:eIF3 subunit 6 N terminal domain-containing protein [Gigaspora rosea]CAG8613299.1 20296_t:CDS:2 [Gigaspora rosea]